MLLFSLRLEISIILFLALIPIAFNYICLRVRALHMRNKEIGGAHFFIPLPQDRGGLVCQSNFLRLACLSSDSLNPVCGNPTATQTTLQQTTVTHLKLSALNIFLVYHRSALPLVRGVRRNSWNSPSVTQLGATRRKKTNADRQKTVRERRHLCHF